MKTRVLSFHAGYGCRNRGRCCTSNWPIGVDASERRPLEAALASSLLTPARSITAAFSADSPPTGSALLAVEGGRCVFHDDEVDGGCRIHRALGHASMPLACRQFPRQSVRDPRGVSITLSHYCPTADELLRSETGAVAIVGDAPAFPAGGEYVGLTADPELPPLLHPELAMNWESWWLFEELSVALLTETESPLARLEMAVDHVRGWTVDRGALSAHVRDGFVRAREADTTESHRSAQRLTQRIVDVLAAVPDDWRASASEALTTRSDAPVAADVRGRYLAAHAFANWSAYQGDGLRSWLRSVEAADCLLSHTGDPGRADLVLRHLADSAALIARWNRAERES